MNKAYTQQELQARATTKQRFMVGKISWEKARIELKAIIDKRRIKI